MNKTKLLSLALAGAMLVPNVVFAKTESVEFDKFEIMSNYAANLYIDDTVDADEIMDEAIRSVVKDNPALANQLIKAAFQSLDKYTEFYSAEDYAEFTKNLNHIVYGIGAVIQYENEYVTIMNCTEGGGAESAGVMPGDKIAAVDGIDTKGMSVDKVQNMVVGELGTSVTITFLRGDSNYFTRTIERQPVEGTTVASVNLDQNTGYMEVVNFAEHTAAEMATALNKFDELGIHNIILDLRNNPGGYLESAVNIAKSIVPEGAIVTTVYRNEHENETFTSGLKNPKYRFVVLVNENTASAAEVLASAIQDSGVGILVGDTTYGKGVIQEMFELLTGECFKITTGRYFTRNGKDINASGIEPDVFIDNSTQRIDISQYTTFDYKTPVYAGETSANVRAAKERLSVLGYYNGEINDVYGPELIPGLIEFQRDNGLCADGLLDNLTQVKMENMFYKIEYLIDNQLEYAYEYFGGDVNNLYE